MSLKALAMSSDSNLMDELIFVEWDVSHDVRTAFAFALLLRRGELVDASDMDDDA
jgi:hypothetical protein